MDEELQFDREMEHILHVMREGGIVRYDDAMRIFSRHLLRSALRHHKGNLTPAAAELGVHRNTLLRLREQCGFPITRRAASGRWRQGTELS